VLARRLHRPDGIEATPGCDVVLRVDDLLPEVLEVLPGHRDSVAPHRVFPDVDGERLRLPADELGAVRQVGTERVVRLLGQKRTKLRVVVEPEGPGVRAAREEKVQPRWFLLRAEHDFAAGLRSCVCTGRASGNKCGSRY